MTEIKLVVYDFDGVMTDNKVYVDQNGLETVQVNRSDGLAVGLIKALGAEEDVSAMGFAYNVESMVKSLGG